MDNPHLMDTDIDSLLTAYTLLIVPVFDVVRVSLVRIWHSRPIFDADKNHIHHKLLRTGLNQHQALGCILGLALIYIVLNSLLCNVVCTELIVAADIVLWVVFHQVVNMAIRKNDAPVFSTPTNE